MNLTAYFSSAHVPATGLTPTITVWKLGTGMVVNAQPMLEIAGGFYYYNFSGYDHKSDYVIQGYAATLQPSERYVIGSNDVDSQRSQGAIKQILGMVQSNFTMTNQDYDSEGRLTFANVYTYANAADANAGTPVLHAYQVDATYDISGNLDSYKVIDL
jgi:hypothetical protein